MDDRQGVVLSTVLGQLRAYRPFPTEFPDRWHVEVEGQLKIELAPGWYPHVFYHHIEDHSDNPAYGIQIASAIIAMVLLSLKVLHPGLPESLFKAIEYYATELQASLANTVRTITPDVIVE
ncbi:hypothetical protein HGA91_02475 [candidate division WWE3 bacterium]|nr:hypothetical protein [candidate division WWE3 bacterium]